MSDASAHAAGWYPDPGGVHEYRFWDGSAWTEHVADRGRQSVAVFQGSGVVPTTADNPGRIERQLRAAGVAPAGPPPTGAPPGSRFTTADNYVVQIHRPLGEPMRSLVVASALSIDTALKQDARGFG
jgi:hypothetical protein